MDAAPRSRSEPQDRSPRDSIRSSEPTLSCVLPWQGSAQALRHQVLPLLDDVSALVQLWELILVDDGCSLTDTAMATWAQVEGIRIVRLTRRFGRDAAITAGLQAAHGDVVVVLQGDDALASQLIAGLLPKWRQGFDVVYAAEPRLHGAQALAVRFGRRLRPWRARLAAMRTAHRALLIDRAALAGFASLETRASGPSGVRRAAVSLRMAVVPTPPLLAAGAHAAGGSRAAATVAFEALRETGRLLGSWLAPPVVDPVFDVRVELGTGLAPRTQTLPPQKASFNRATQPHA